MKKLLNTLYVTTPDVYLSLEGENVVILRKDEVLIRVPLHNLESILTFGYTGASPALMGACAERKIALSFFTLNGRFIADISGIEQGNVILRRTQYRYADDLQKSAVISRNILLCKLHNGRWVLERVIRDHGNRINAEDVKAAVQIIVNSIKLLQQADDLESMRGIEGVAAAAYFSAFDEMIIQSKESFFFHARNRRPPLDNVNALLSFTYSILANDIASAIRAAGLDPFVGFLHRDRPGRRSLALDMLEELRPIFADRFVLTLINNRIVGASDFYVQENGAVRMKDDARKEFLNAWQTRKQEEFKHPYLNESIEWGLVPHVQALLMARFLRGDLDEYPPFFWK